MKQTDMVVRGWTGRRIRYRQSDKPGVSDNFFRGLILGFPLSSVIWAGIIYATARLIR